MSDIPAAAGRRAIDAGPMADLRDRGDRVRVRHLRAADAAVDPAAGVMELGNIAPGTPNSAPGSG